MVSQFESETVWQLDVPEIRFGRDAVRDLGYQLRTLGVDPGARGLAITDESIADIGHADRVRACAEDDGFELDVFDGVAREPTTADVQRCVEYARGADADYEFFVGLGGGSALDTAKVTRAVVENGGEVAEYAAERVGEARSIAPCETSLVAIPTTVGTPAQISMTAVVRSAEDGGKLPITDQEIRPDGTIADPTFTVTLPPDLTAETVMDALGPAIESYTAPSFSSRPRPDDPSRRLGPAGRTELTDVLNERAIRLISNNVRQVVHNGSDLEARTRVMRGSLFAAVAGRAAGVHLGHAAAYAVQELYHTRHSETVGVLTPACTLGYNVGSDPTRFERVAELLGADVDGLGTRDAADEAKREYVRLQRDLSVVPSGLAELAGVSDDEETLRELAVHTMETEQRLLRNAPALLTEDGLVEMYRDALHNW